MFEYGKIRNVEKINSGVCISFEKANIEVHILTKWIIRFFTGMMQEPVHSKAIAKNDFGKTFYQVERLSDHVEIRTEKLSVQIFDGGLIDIYDKNGTVLCLDYRGEQSVSHMTDQETKKLMEQEGHCTQSSSKEHRIRIAKQMIGDECFYGLGDKTGFLNKCGYDYVNWNTDNPRPHVDSFKQLYKSIPFFITLRKDAVFGIFFDNTFRTYFDMGKESGQYYWFGADQGNLDYYFIGGSDMKEVVSGYTQLTGRAPLPQFWTLGYHQSRWGYRCEEDVRRVAAQMREHDIPCDVIHLDIDYMDGYRVFTIDKKKFPDMKQLTEDLSKVGIRLVTIMDPGVKSEKGYLVYDDGTEKNYFAQTPDGSIYENVVWPGESVYPDFGRVEVREWWGSHYRLLTDNGIAGIWTDMNEPAGFQGELPDDIVFFDEDRTSDHAEMHNVYGHNMARATYEALWQLTKKRPFVITRACYSGTQRYSTAWTGDNHSIWSHLQMAIPQMCNMGISGMPYIGTDIGGFGSDTTKELMCRWIEVGCFSPLCRNHSSADTLAQEPWEWGEETIRVYRKFLKLRYMLLPYYYDLCKKETHDGLPMLRPLVLNYEKDENTKNLNGEFMLGDSLLVAPVVEQGMMKKLVYLPEGIWYNFWTGEKLEGTRYIICGAELDECPIFVKGGSIIPMIAPGRWAAEKKDEELYLDIYPDENGAVNEYLHYQDNGEDFAYLNGEYNLYRFTFKNGEYHTELLHEGYSGRYKKISCMDPEMKEEVLACRNYTD
ncbi:MAG: glycoside hydrolase family 31 protein [Lachnospiraceae bacterium]|nr:glycoside hydrolase family 31 protein [Lachnospiraceae bacterium]